MADILKELHKLAQISGLWKDGGIRAAIEMLPLIPNEQVRERRAQHLLRYLTAAATTALANGAEDHPFLPQPEPEEIPPGEIVLGLLDDELVGIPISALQTHMLVSGPTKKGKTFAILSVLVQLIKLGIPVHVFDTQGDYADMLPALCPEARVIRFQDFRRNPFEAPPAIPQEEWLQHMTNYLRECFFYRDGVVNLFRALCQRIRESGQEFNSRAFADEYHRTPRTIRREADYFQSLNRFVTAISKDTYQCTSGFDLMKLSSLPVVFDLTAMANDWRLFFIADLVTWYQASRSYRRDRELELVLVFDELSRFYSEEAAKRSDLGEPFILQMVRESRKKGMAVILADQSYSSFHKVVRTNCQTKIIFETIDGPSRMEIARDLLLDQEQQQFLGEMSFAAAPERRIVVQVPTLPEPLLLLVPHVVVPPHDTRPAGLQEFAWMPLPEEEEPKQKKDDAIPYELLQYLAVIANHPFLKETDYDDQLAKPRARGTRLRAKLKDLGLVEEHEINQYKPGRHIKVILPTDGGYDLLDRHRIGYNVPQGNGGIAHKYWQHVVARKLQKEGWKVRIEQTLRGKHVDVGAIKGDERVAYEILMEGLEKELTNLKKDLEDGWGSVIFCVDYEETREHLARVIPEIEDRVEIRLLKEFV
jgi:hypothetical protein